MNNTQAARGLGWFSLGLGAVELAAAPQLTTLFGIEGKEATFRTLGAREVTNGYAILRKRRPGAGTVWARVLGDIIDATAFATSMREPGAKRGRIWGAIAFVAVAGIADFVVAKALSNRRI
jgi:hypothetical protein